VIYDKHIIPIYRSVLKNPTEWHPKRLDNNLENKAGSINGGWHVTGLSEDICVMAGLMNFLTRSRAMSGDI
jgi:hypothetical protein